MTAAFFCRHRVCFGLRPEDFYNAFHQHRCSFLSVAMAQTRMFESFASTAISYDRGGPLN
jgi:hypothetical protein